MKPQSQTENAPSMLAITTSGCMTGVLQVVLSSSYAALIFGGVLNLYVGQGIGFALFGAIVIASIIALFAAWPGTVGSNQDVSVAIFSIISASIVASMPEGASSESVFCTVVVAISLGVLLTGFFLWGLGIMKLGGLIRYFPYPVVGGFLAGTGWLLFIGGLSLTCGQWSFEELFKPQLLTRWLPSLLFSLVLFLVVKRFNCGAALPGVIFFGILFFYGSAQSMGISLDTLREGGWLLGPFSENELWQPFTIEQFSLVDWSIIVEQAINIITVVAVCSITLLLNASAFELETRKDIDLNRELRLAGIVNFLSCFAHGFVGFRQLSLTVLNFKMNAQSRLVGMIGVAILSLTLIFGTSLISYFPRAIMGGLVMYLGLTFLVEWAFETYFRLPKIDFALIWMVLIVIAIFGFIPGIGVGLFAAVVMFVVSYSRTEVIRLELTGRDCQSIIPRSHNQRQVLAEQSDSLYVLQLQGFIFFGTANRLFNKIKERLETTNSIPLAFVILDFKRIDTLDSTGILSFRKLKNLTNLSNTNLIFTSISPEIKQQLIAGGLCPIDSLTHYFPTLNSGVEWCEEQILNNFPQNSSEGLTLAQQFAELHPEHTNIAPLMSCLEHLDIEPGATLLHEGDSAEGFYFIESGRVTTRTGHKECNSSTETLKDGTTIGDICFYLGRDHFADVVATEQCTVYGISKKRLQQIETESPEVAIMLHKIMARMLAERVTHLLETVSVFQK